MARPRARLPAARTLVALLATLLVLAGCGRDGSGFDDSGGADAADPEDPAALDLEQADLGEPVDLEDGVAAIVNGEEIADEEVEERFAAVVRVPEVADQLEGEDGDRITEMLRAHILQNLITQLLVAHGAEQLGVEPTEEDVAVAEEQAITSFDGDRDEFFQALEDEGVTQEQLHEELLYAARVEAITAHVVDQVARDGLGGGEDLGLDAADLALQQWLGEQLAQGDVAVDEQYGVWNPQSGEVVPPSFLEPAG